MTKPNCACLCGCGNYRIQDELFCHPCLYSDHRIEMMEKEKQEKYNKKMDSAVAGSILLMLKENQKFRKNIVEILKPEIISQFETTLIPKETIDHASSRRDNMELAKIIFYDESYKKDEHMLSADGLDFINRFGHTIIGSPFSNMTQPLIELKFKTKMVKVEDIFAVCKNLIENDYDVNFNNLYYSNDNSKDTRYQLDVWKKKKTESD